MTPTFGELRQTGTAVHGAILAAVLACALALAILCIASPSQAQARADNTADSINLLQSFYLEDQHRQLGAQQALAKLRAGDGVPLPGGRFNLANYDSHFWLYLRLANNSQAAQRWTLDTGVPFRAGISAYLLPNGAPWKEASAILQTDDLQIFHERAGDTVRLQSELFDVGPGAVVEILLDYQTRGSTYMPLAVKTAADFDREQASAAVRSTLFYATCLVILLLMFLFGLALRNMQVLGYATLFLCSLLFIAANEGYGYQYLWPQMPRWNQYAGLFFMLFGSGLSFLVARHAMDAELLTPLRIRILLGLALLSFGLSLLSGSLPFSLLVNSGSLLVLGGYIAQMITITSWLRAAVKRHLVSLGAILITIPCIAALIALTIIGFDLPDLVFEHGARAIYFFSVISTAAALILHIMAMHVQHEQSLEQALAAARRDARLSRALLDAEQKYTQAQQLAAHRKEQLATTSHDIRQPLTSLRAVIDSGTLAIPETEKETLQRSLDYIEQLSQPQADAPSSLSESATEESSSVEPYRADLLLQTVERMFQGEANEKQVKLRTVACSVLIDKQPMALMRILTNLVSNAIKHCERGSVLLGCRRVGDSVRFDVLDNGPGMDTKTLARLRQPYEKGEHSEGEGLGLAICWQLAADNGLTLEVASSPGLGSHFKLLLHHN